MFVNTEEFKPEAKHFEKYGRYCDDPFKSPAWTSYWQEQRRRCREGYSVGGVYITGDHYAYLNFSRIRITREDNDWAKVTKKRIRKASKKEVSPDFWDGDYDYFHCLDIAENGADQKYIDNLGLSVDPVTDGLGGQHLQIGKARRKGYSYKNAATAANRVYTRKGYTVLLGAYDTEYLYPRGTMSMVRNQMTFLDTHTGFAKRKLIDNNEHVKIGFRQKDSNGNYLEKGYLSQIFAISFYGNPGAARGKDPDWILFEEGGKWPNLLQSIAETQSSGEDGMYVTAIITLFGTGGGDNTNWEGFEKIFYNPSSQGFIEFKNQWDPGASHTHCSLFHPSIKNFPGAMDENGNSLEDKADDFLENKREMIRNTTNDQQQLINHIMENAKNPREAFQRSSNNIFTSEVLTDWRQKVFSENLHINMGIPGYMEPDKNGNIRFIVDRTYRQPLYDYPERSGKSREGCIVKYLEPAIDEATGKVPDNLYMIAHDPYADDSDTGPSLGAAYVYKNINNFSHPDDLIVASYVGRPKTQDEYNKNLFYLAMYYNAKIGYESDTGDVLGYAKRHKLTSYLAEEFELNFDERLKAKNPSSNLRYGMKMGAGKESARKKQGDIYLRDWLYTERGIDDKGNKIYNLHRIYDLALLDELIKYGNGNFDRISAMRILMYFQKEIEYNNVAPKKARHSSPFDVFEKQLF